MENSIHMKFAQTSEPSLRLLWNLIEIGKKLVSTTGENLHAVGGTRWYMDLFTNHSKPSLIGRKHSHPFGELLKLGCDWLSRLQTTVRTTNNRKASPLESLRLFLFLLEFINLLRRKTGLWFEAIQFVGRRTILSTMLAWFSRKSAHIRTKTSSGS